MAIGNLQVTGETHPVADLFPLMRDDQIRELADDIAVHGLREALWVVPDGRILDGRNRFRACVLAGVAPVTRVYDGPADSFVSFVVSLNLHRRHLDESQRAMVAGRLATLGDGQRKSGRSIDLATQDEAADLLNVSVPSVKRARAVLTEGTPDLVAAVDAGAIAVSAAADVAALEPVVQHAIVADVHNGIPARDAIRKHAIHFSSETPEHYTPSRILDAVYACLGGIDLDPCSNEGIATVAAAQHFTAADDGLAQPWHGRVYMNPPYGREIESWVDKLVAEHTAGRVTQAIALVPARTDTQWFLKLSEFPCCFVIGRLTFVGNADPAPFPSAIFYLGDDVGTFFDVFMRQYRIGNIWQVLIPEMFGE